MKSLRWIILSAVLSAALFLQGYFITKADTSTASLASLLTVELKADKSSVALGGSFDLQVRVITTTSSTQTIFEGSPADGYISVSPTNGGWTAWMIMDERGNMSWSNRQIPLVTNWTASTLDWFTLTKVVVPNDQAYVGRYVIAGYLVPAKTQTSSAAFTFQMEVTDPRVTPTPTPVPTTVPTPPPAAYPELVQIKAGTFSMGSADTDASASPQEKPQHQVTITQDFYIGKTEVTNAQFCSFLNDGYDAYYTTQYAIVKDGSNFIPTAGKENHPVVNVSWNTAMTYCDWLSDKTGDAYTLPTEAQWEYACRSGTTTKYYWGDQYVGGNANYNTAGTTPVGSYPPNAWGLYDMSGNVWEWCADNYQAYSAGAVTDPLVDLGYTARVVRGGGWNVDPTAKENSLRPAYRNSADASNTLPYGGFRVAATK
jgi:formylglycine-generating enzyme required for sulfatase activity